MMHRSPFDAFFLSHFHAARNAREHHARFLGEQGSGRSTLMPFALFARDGALLLRTPLPGLEARDVALEVDGNTLTIAGQWPGEPEGDAAEAKHVERPRGRFSRTLRAPYEIDAARVQARLERGVLEVEIPRLVKNTPVKIQVLPQEKRN